MQKFGQPMSCSAHGRMLVAKHVLTQSQSLFIDMLGLVRHFLRRIQVSQQMQALTDELVIGPQFPRFARERISKQYLRVLEAIEQRNQLRIICSQASFGVRQCFLAFVFV